MERATQLLSDGKSVEAEELFQAVLAIEQELFGANHEDVLGSLQMIAQCQEARGEWDDARATRENELSRTVALDNDDYRTTDAQLGLVHLERLQRLGHEQRRNVHNALFLSHQVLQLRKQGSYSKALPLAEQVVTIRREVLGELHPDYAWSLNFLALLYDYMEDYARAEPLYQEAAEIRKKVLGERHPVYAQSLNNLAGLYRSQGDYVRAEPLYRQAMEIRKTVLGVRHPDYAQSLNNLALLYKTNADFKRAEPLYREASAIWKEVQGECHDDYAISLNNLAQLYESMADYARAEPLYRQALEIRQAVLGERHPDFATSLNSLASLYQTQGNCSQAESLYQQALEIKKQALGERHSSYATSLNNLAALYAQQADYARAEPLYRQALEIKKEVLGERHPDYAQSLHNQALLLPELGRATEGFPLSDQAVRITAAIIDATAAVQSERQQLAMAESLIHYSHGMLSLGRLAGVDAAALYPLPFRSKGQVFVRQRAIRQLRDSPEQSPDSRSAQTFARLSDRARLLDQLAKQTPDPGAAFEHQECLEQLTLEIEQLQQTLSALSAEFRQAQQATVVTPDDVAARLPADAALVDLRQYAQYLPHDADHPTGRWEWQYAAFIMRRDQPPDVVWLGPSEPINVAVAAWHEHLGAGPSLAASRELRELVWARLAPQLDGVTIVLVSPDGPLNQFPWGALPGDDPDSYLIEEYAFVGVPVPSLLPQIIDRASDPEAQPSLLAIGDVNYGADPGVMQLASRDRSATAARSEEAIEKWGPLAETRVEVAAIEDTHDEFFPDARRVRLRRDKATEQAFRTTAPEATVLHVATHGYFAPESLKSLLSNTRNTERATSLFQQQDVSGWHPGLLSGIVLAGANNEPQPDKDDGVLTALEVAQLDLSNADLVTLSACETGLGKTAGGEGVLGLQRAFQLAGARTTITSLWKVRDDATRSLMVRFYENLWKHKLTRVEALRQAQLATMRDTSLRGADPVGDGEAGDRLPPRYWAAFVLSGDWR